MLRTLSKSKSKSRSDDTSPTPNGGRVSSLRNFVEKLLATHLLSKINFDMLCLRNKTHNSMNHNSKLFD
jgi:hypothetical protein